MYPRSKGFSSLVDAHSAFVQYGTHAESFNVAVGRYVIMPDHIHLFVCGPHDFILAEWIKGLKRGVSNAFRLGPTRLRWQPGFFDHLLRNDESYAQKWNYIRENPVRAGLVDFANDWSYQGEIVYIDRA